MGNSGLSTARKAKKDEFYTQLTDIEYEMNAYLDFNKDVFRGKTVLCPCDDPETSAFTQYFSMRFEQLGLKKLITTSYAPLKNNNGAFYTATEWYKESSQYNPERDLTHGKLFILDGRDRNGDGKINAQDLTWEYLEGDGDFRSAEITKLRDEADFIITGPPFSLFRELIDWLIEGKVRFSVIGNINATAYSTIFPLIKNNTIWYGLAKGVNFRIPQSYMKENTKYKYDTEGNPLFLSRYARWFTNIQHGRRHEPLQLLNMEDNKRFNKRISNNPNSYKKYDNYDAIEVPSTDGIPSDYDGVMGVPISFLDKYCPEQFDIISGWNGGTSSSAKGAKMTEYFDKKGNKKQWNGPTIDKKPLYFRFLIRHKKPAN